MPDYQWVRLEPPINWKKHNLTVIGDRHVEDGRRQHIVKGSVPAGTVIADADIFGEDEPTWVAQQTTVAGD